MSNVAIDHFRLAIVYASGYKCGTNDVADEGLAMVAIDRRWWYPSQSHTEYQGPLAYLQALKQKVVGNYACPKWYPTRVKEWTE
jgi:hypothetical protein